MGYPPKPFCSGSPKPSGTQENFFMQTALVYAFLVVAVAPLIGIWRGHAWAKANGLVLRTACHEPDNQAA
jgi:hypothetical protein